MLNNYKWTEYDTHGREDNDFWNYFNNRNMCVREEVNDYYHQWHPENLEFKIKYWRNNDINNQKNRKIITNYQKVKKILNEEININKKYIRINKVSKNKKEKIKNLINFIPNLEIVEDENQNENVINITNIKINNTRYSNLTELVLKIHNEICV